MAIGVGIIQSLLVTFVKRYNYDEFMFGHAGWEISQGRLPYRDFFAVHHPLTFHLSETTPDQAILTSDVSRTTADLWSVHDSLLTYAATCPYASLCRKMRTNFLMASTTEPKRPR